jgi:ascorbate PTS system EIIC component
MDILVSLLSNPAILLGIVAFIGLAAQKKSGVEVITGSAKTAIGFLIFGIGAGTMTVALQKFNAMFQAGFHITGVITSPEAATAMAQSTYAFVTSAILIIGFIMNLVFARITPFKNVFFTGGHSLFFACVLGLILKFHGFSDGMAIAIGGTILGFCSAFLPQLCQPFMRKMTGNDDQAIGHFNMLAYALSGWIGKTFFSKWGEYTTETIHFPKYLSFFRDFLMGCASVMALLFYVSALAAGPDVVQKLAGTTNWLVFPGLLALQFTAGMSVLMTGVRMFLGEIVAAFVAISEKFIPGSRPALDVPTVFPYAPTAVIVGFLCSYAAGLLAIVVMVLMDSSVIIIPAAHICFFSGGTAGVFGNSFGGWRGAVAGSFVAGLLLAFLPAILYPLFGQMGVMGSTFPNVDYNVVGMILNGGLNLFQ